MLANSLSELVASARERSPQLEKALAESETQTDLALPWQSESLPLIEVADHEEVARLLASPETSEKLSWQSGIQAEALTNFIDTVIREGQARLAQDFDNRPYEGHDDPLGNGDYAQQVKEFETDEGIRFGRSTDYYQQEITQRVYTALDQATGQAVIVNPDSEDAIVSNFNNSAFYEESSANAFYLTAKRAPASSGYEGMEMSIDRPDND